MTTLAEEDADELLRALAHPARREILRRCWDQPMPAGALADALDLAPASVSEHLKVLRKTGLAVLTREGTFRWYRADPARVAALTGWLATFPTSLTETS
ncbi:ArsR/SmtB family transcription factor [Paractinoplanes durhamensis]|uniref:ArsR/SmtB family transcription factor n=1 Tax=Paractinoplanes durhamensis TaxID=113563 RepID=UPI001941E6C1|nr:metalloregulator ArsR/SmtB family transcription factor [Actinoplanes durhamensis]